MKTVLITGAGGGMGRATARLLASEGYKVFALDINPPSDEESVIPIKADVTDEESLKAAFAAVVSSTEKLDAVLHFAGIYMLDSLIELESEAYRRIYNVNVHGAFLVNKVFFPILKKGARVIITTSELAALDPLPFTGIYAVTKGALDKYAFALRMELQLLGLKVSVLRAGAVKTDMLGVSTAALDRFCERTEIYSCNARRFKSIVESVEARCVPPERIAKKALGILKKKNPKFAYRINANPLLLMLNILPRGMQFYIIRKILKK